MLGLLMGLCLAQVATVDGVPLSEESFLQAAIRVAPADGLGLDREERLAVVEELVDEELLYQQALRMGFDQDPTVQKMMVNLLLRDQVYAQVRNADFTDDMLRAWFEEHREDFVVPEKVNFRTLTLRVEDGEDASAVREELMGLREQLLVADDATARLLILEHSEDRWVRRGGDVGFVARPRPDDETPPAVEPALVEVAFGQEVGAVSLPVRTESGWTLVITRNRRPEIERSFQQMRGSVLRSMKNARLEELYDAYVVELWERAEVRVSRAWLRRQDEPLPRPAKGARQDAIASFDDQAITELLPEDGESELQALVRQIDDELLLREALALGVDQAPKVRKIMVNALLRQEVYASVSNDDFSDDELRAYYEAHLEDFVAPEKVQLRTLTLSYGPDRGRTLDEALEQTEAWRASILDDTGRFDALATDHSEDSYARRGGNVGFVSREGKPGLDPALVELAFSLAEGQLSEPVVLDHAVVLISVEAHRERVERTYEQMKGSVLRVVKNQRIQLLYEAYVAGLGENVEVVVLEDRMMALEVAQSRPTGGTVRPASPAGETGED